MQVAQNVEKHQRNFHIDLDSVKYDLVARSRQVVIEEFLPLRQRLTLPNMILKTAKVRTVFVSVFLALVDFFSPLVSRVLQLDVLS